jgi:hypothetical protein
MADRILTFEELLEKLRKSYAHCYNSENADHYRGYDAGKLRAANDLQPLFDALRGKVKEWHSSEWAREAIKDSRPAEDICADELNALLLKRKEGA